MLQLRRFGRFACLAAASVFFGTVTQAAVDKSKAASAANTNARHALVIGNAAYSTGSLASAGANARALSKRLRALGFKVDLNEDVTAESFRRALAVFAEKVGRDSIALVYFAGHVVRSQNEQLLLPIDLELDVEKRRVRNAMAVNTLFSTLARRNKAGANIVIIDSAPYPTEQKYRGLRIETAPVKAPANFLIADSNGMLPRAAAKSELSLYTQQFIEAVSTPSQSAEAVFQSVNAAVSAQTDGKYLPWHRSTLSQDVFLSQPFRAAVPNRHGKSDESMIRGIRLTEKEIPKSPAAEQSVRGRATAQATKSTAEFETTLWSMIQDSKDPADFEAYLEVFPNGQFQKQAQKKIAVLRTPSVAKPAKPKRPVIKIESMRAEFQFAYAGKIRKRPDKSAPVLDRARKGDRIKVTGRVVGSDWLQVSTRQGTVAYVSSRILRKPQPERQPPRKATPPVAKPKVAVIPPRVLGAAESQSKVFRDCAECPEMVQIPPGSFRMGYDGGDPSERPARTVRIGNRIAVSKFEVTIGQWNACVAAKDCTYRPRTKNAPAASPVFKLSWQDAQSYIKWLRRVTGKPYRLLSEAEWEYAARGGTYRKYWWGKSMKAGFADCKGCGGTWSYKFPAPAEKVPANQFGLHGMNGGVWEWTQDCWNPNHNSSPTDGSAVTRGDCSARVLRGGSWRNDAGYAHASSRLRYDFNVRYSTNGFRVARDMQ